MTDIGTKIIKISRIALSAVVLFGVAFFCTDAAAANLSKNSYSPNLKIGGLLPECTYPQKSGGGKCLENLNAKSCLNTTPFSPIGRGVSSEMCARGKSWCARNDPGRKHRRCQNVAKGIVKNHEGYDYSAQCGTPIYAPCDGKITQCKTSGGSAGLYFKCNPDAVCGKNIEFRFYHNQGCKPNGSYKRGNQIGSSGKVSGYPCHMHIEIREGGVLLDPMNSGFDNYVCGCKSNEKVNRLNCFTGGAAPATEAVDTGYDTALTEATGEAVADANGGQPQMEENCTYAIVAENYQQAGCMFCKPFRILFNTASIMAKVAYDNLSEAVSIVVIIAFAIWMAVIIMQFISSFEIKEPRIMIKTLLNQAFRVLVIVLLLKGPLGDVLSMTLDPVFSTGLKIAQIGGGLVAGDNPAECNLTSGGDAVAIGDTGTVKAVGTGDDLSVVGSDVGGLSPELGNGIICTVKSIQDQIMDVMAIARVCWCLAWEDASVFGLIPNFGYLLTSFAFFVAAFLLMMIYPFLLVDSILKMAIAIALFPAALGAFAFKITSQYLMKVWNVFINAIFTFIFLSLIILIISTIAKQYVTEIITTDVKEGAIMGPILWYTVGAAKIMFVLFLGWAVLHEAKDFADKFAASINLNGIGSKTGSAFGAATKGLVAKPAFKLGKKAVKAGGRLAKENAGHYWRKFKAQRFKEDGDGLKSGMVDEDGEDMYHTFGSAWGSHAGYAWNSMMSKIESKGNSRLGRAWNKLNNKLKANTHETYHSFHTDENGNVKETKTKIYSNGRKVVTQSDVYGSVTRKEMADGSVAVTKQKGRSAIRKLVNKKGEVDMEALNGFMQNSLLSEKDKSLMIMSQLMKDRMGSYTGGSLDGIYKGRSIDNITTDSDGNRVISIRQINEDGTESTFTATFHSGNRVMTTVSTIGGDGKGYEYSTDGIIQRKTIIDGDKVEHRYSVASHYSDQTTRPVYIDGSVASNIDESKILFGKEDMKRFGEQVRTKGNKAYDLSEFL